jgi:hypothetical protein
VKEAERVHRGVERHDRADVLRWAANVDVMRASERGRADQLQHAASSAKAPVSPGPPRPFRYPGTPHLRLQPQIPS